eukprot:Nk52_evm29s356 gene=Nk52_evmTU29s356
MVVPEITPEQRRRMEENKKRAQKKLNAKNPPADQRNLFAFFSPTPKPAAGAPVPKAPQSEGKNAVCSKVPSLPEGPKTISSCKTKEIAHKTGEEVVRKNIDFKPTADKDTAAARNATVEEDGDMIRPRRSNKRVSYVVDSDDEDDIPLSSRKGTSSSSKRKKVVSDDDDEFTLEGGEEPSDDEGDAMDVDMELEEEEKAKPVKPATRKKDLKMDLNSFQSPAVSKKQSSFLSPAMSTPSSFRSASSPFTSTPSSASKNANQERLPWLENPRDAKRREPGDPDFDPSTLYIPDSAFNKMTPFEKQYFNIKKKLWNVILFFKKGKFYELYEKDALIGQKEFDLKLTDRVNMCMVGVPEMSFSLWASKFIALGYKVGKVDEMENSITKGIREKKENTKKDKIIRRELKSVLTAGTLMGDMVVDDMSPYIMCIKEDADWRKYGICLLDSSTSEWKLCSFEDDENRTRFETLVVQMKPKEVVYEKTLTQQDSFSSSTGISARSKQIIKNSLSFTPTVSLQSPFWASEQVASNIESGEYFANSPEPEQLRAAREDELLFSAFGGLLRYLKSLQIDKELLSQCKVVRYNPLEEGYCLLLDGQTLLNLDILQCTSDSGSSKNDTGNKGSLLGLLNHCRSPFGKREFVRWLCHPIMNIPELNGRYDAIEDLSSNTDLLDEISSALSSLPDLERLVSRVHTKHCKVKDFLVTLKGFREVSDLMKILKSNAEDLKSKRLVSICNSKVFEGVIEIVEGTEKLFNKKMALSESTIQPTKGACKEYDDVNDEILEMEEKLQMILLELRKKLKCRSIGYKHINKEPYQLEIPVGITVPSSFELKSQTKSIKRYWSPEISKLMTPWQEAKETRRLVLEQQFDRVLEHFDSSYNVLTAAVDKIAELDCLVSLTIASRSIGEPVCRPELFEAEGREPFLELKSMRHPCISEENGMFSKNFIPNDTCVGNADGNGQSQKNIIILTGPNMGGKSTLLRQTCIAVIMAQIGCLVPAASCKLTPVDRIFTRIGANDNILAGQSTFMVELSETSNILRSATKNSLVILDELGRGTSTYDGYAIAYAVLNHIATTLQCRTMFSTHYHLLTEEFTSCPVVAFYHMACQVNEESKEVTFLYELQEGVCPKSYGMHVANMAGVPSEIVENAEMKAENMEKMLSGQRLLGVDGKSCAKLKALLQCSSKEEFCMIPA